MNSWSHLITPQCDVTRRQTKALEYVSRYRGSCSRTCEEYTSGVVLVNTLSKSCAEAVERDMLVAYWVIDTREIMGSWLLTC